MSTGPFGPCLPEKVERKQNISDNGNNVKPLLQPRHAIELFHSHFTAKLDALTSAEAYAIKGGCNLRMLLGSPRASEDLDLDIHQVAKHTLQKRVENIIAGLAKSFPKNGVSIASYTAPKQTETVQRWKITLVLLGQEIPTKVEFSRRSIQTPSRGPIVKTFESDYGVKTMLSHYGPDIALDQKIKALAGRNISQARDVFDAAYLTGIGARHPESLGEEILNKAINNTASLTFEDYTGQVIPYLEETDAEKFGTEQVWDGLKKQVLSMLRTIPVEILPLGKTGDTEIQ